MLLIERIAEEKIQEAIERGEFDNLPGKGKPLTFQNDPAMPDSLRTSYKILKNAGVLPEELQLRKEIHSLEEMLQECENLNEEKEVKRELNQKELRYNLLMERRGRTPAHRKYENQIIRKIR